MIAVVLKMQKLNFSWLVIYYVDPMLAAVEDIAIDSLKLDFAKNSAFERYYAIFFLFAFEQFAEKCRLMLCKLINVV